MTLRIYLLFFLLASSIAKHATDKEFLKFLEQIENQAANDRTQNERPFIPDIRDERFEADKIGREFLKCRIYSDINDLSVSKAHRCVRHSPEKVPVCFFLVSPGQKKISGGCAEISESESVGYPTNCTFHDEEKKGMAASRSYMCQCLGKLCNEDYKEMIKNLLRERFGQKN